MKFGRVEGRLHWTTDGETPRLSLTVVLETATGVTVVRDEPVEPPAALPRQGDLVWLADQYTQETIAVDLAQDGWEVISGTDSSHDGGRHLPQSATYTVRKL